MRLQDKQVGSPQILYRDTQANIEALDEVVAGAFAYATDLEKVGYYTGSEWVWGSTSATGSPSGGTSILEVQIFS